VLDAESGKNISLGISSGFLRKATKKREKIKIF